MTKVPFNVVGAEPDKTLYRKCRRMLVGPWCNQPEEYEGYNGFVGWPGVTALRSGRLLVAFNSGYWHASYPWTDEIHENVKNNEKFYEMLQKWRDIGMPTVNAPRGGRSHTIHSDDDGRSWSRPVTLVDTEWSDLHSTILELDDGTLVCTFCSVRLPLVMACRHMLSHDQGATWTEPITLDDVHGGFGNGSTIKLADGALLWVMEDRVDEGNEFLVKSPAIAIYRSADNGKSFHRHATVSFGHDVYEPSIVELPGGRLAIIARREGEMCFSDDGGVTWSEPVSTGVEVFDPHLLMLPNGVLACFHGSYHKEPGALRVILSPDGGQTWNGPHDKCGYSIDPTVYGYSQPIVLPDGTVLLVYIHTGGHTPGDARTEAIWAIRVKVNDAADGIEILPAAPGAGAGEHGMNGGLDADPDQQCDAELGNYAG